MISNPNKSTKIYERSGKNIFGTEVLNESLNASNNQTYDKTLGETFRATALLKDISDINGIAKEEIKYVKAHLKNRTHKFLEDQNRNDLTKFESLEDSEKSM